MKRHKLYMSVRLILLATCVLSLGMSQGWAQNNNKDKNLKLRGGKVTTAEKKAAADRAKAQGLKPGVAGTLNVAIPAPNGAPDGPGGIRIISALRQLGLQPASDRQSERSSNRGCRRYRVHRILSSPSRRLRQHRTAGTAAATVVPAV